MTISDECLNSVLLQGSQGLDHLVGRARGGGAGHRFHGKNRLKISPSVAAFCIMEADERQKGVPGRLWFSPPVRERAQDCFP